MTENISQDDGCTIRYAPAVQAQMDALAVQHDAGRIVTDERTNLITEFLREQERSGIYYLPGPITFDEPEIVGNTWRVTAHSEWRRFRLRTEL